MERPATVWQPKQTNWTRSWSQSYVDRINALALAGDNASFAAEWFGQHFHRTREAGWHATTHPGEYVCLI